MAWQLLVIDGADQGRSFPLPLAGTILVGNSRKHADVCLNDLYVARVHCQVDIKDDRVTVTHVQGAHGTFVNGQKIAAAQEWKPGEVLRVGNSHLRLDEWDGVPPSASSFARAVGAGRAPDSLEDLTEHTLSHYEVGPLLGRGHHGVVFRAQDTKNNRTVALKVLSPDFPKSEAELQAFARALKPALPLRHPNLIALFGAGKTGAYSWIAREYVEGEGLGAICQRQRDARKLDWTFALQVAMHVGKALEVVHQNHLMHGNVTPQNILIRAGNPMAAKLADLAFNKAVEGSALQRSVMEPKFLAELPYLAPEQAEPGAFVDNLCDIYSLGAVVYELLTGRPPFSGENPEDVLDQIRTSEPDKPRKYQRAIPAEFERIVLKMLAKHQEDRHATPTQLLADLEPLAEESEAAV